MLRGIAESLGKQGKAEVSNAVIKLAEEAAKGGDSLRRLWDRPVVVEGLKARPELNGREGICGVYRADRKRFLVRVALPEANEEENEDGGAMLSAPVASLEPLLLSAGSLRCAETGAALEPPVQVGEAGGKGEGVFAVRAIEPGAVCFSEEAICAMRLADRSDDRFGELVAFTRAFRALGTAAQGDLLALGGGPFRVTDPTSGKSDDKSDAEIVDFIGLAAGEAVPEHEAPNLARAVRVLHSSVFFCSRAPHPTEALFPTLAKINHSCDPNCEALDWCAEGKPQLDLIALRPIAPGEELTISYIGAEACKPRAERAKQLAGTPHYIAECACKLCADGGEEPAQEAREALPTLLAARTLQVRYRCTPASPPVGDVGAAAR